MQVAADKLKAAGAELIEVSLPSLPLALAVYYILCPAEVSSNLSRYDGQRYGYSYPAYSYGYAPYSRPYYGSSYGAPYGYGWGY